MAGAAGVSNLSHPEDPDACNVYKELDLPDEVFRHIEEYREQQFATDEAAR